MSEPFVGEIRILGFNFAPVGWAFCDGQLLSIAQNDVLFAVIGTTYGGDGEVTFGLPDLRDRAPMHWGNGPNLTPRTIGQMLGNPNITLTVGQMPAHNHIVNTALPLAGEATATPASNTWLGKSLPDATFNDSHTPSNTSLSQKSISVTGGSQPHENQQPLLTMNFCIALEGLFPSRN